MPKEIAPHKEVIPDPLVVEWPAPSLKRLASRMTTIDIRAGEKSVAAIDRKGSLSSRHTRLRFFGRRYRMDRPDDASWLEDIGNFFRSMAGMPRRRRIWRAGAGVATEIRETSRTHRQLSGRFEIDGQPYSVQSELQGFLKSDYHHRLFGPRGATAVLDRSDFSRYSYFLTPFVSTRLDVLVIAVHMMFWLEESVSRGGGGVGGAGGGGGDGGGGGGG